MEELPDKNIFMMCKALNTNALSELPKGYITRNCRKDELGIWKSMPFDDPITANEYDGFMTEFFNTTYGDKEELFYNKTLFVCDQNDRPIATCLLWEAYGEFNSIHWLKVLKGYEGLGIGRALLSVIMKDLKSADYPVYLHTQPESYRAIKLYSDFGFYLLSDDKFGPRKNDLEDCWPILKKYMPEKDFQNLKTTTAPEHFISSLKKFSTIQF
ncbi:GNAT family N-acetyltransferase [Fulvivirgaceae bacterium BMA12]|uniref:GNAT family N-acetyltransferase n=1 Tax=Agaribacillus aureus TaxID=3051825 RepID=A0ABT8LDZ7_9BACT|nr:GNAT family N-acetyltransferase [Fulvivirgaceae bacterium BMA12]